MEASFDLQNLWAESPPFLRSNFAPPPVTQDRDLLVEAIESESYEDVKRILENDDSLVHMPARARGQHESAVMCALRSSAPADILRLLLQHGALVDQADSNGDRLYWLTGPTQLPLLEANPYADVVGDCAGDKAVASKSFLRCKEFTCYEDVVPQTRLLGSLQMLRQDQPRLTAERRIAYAVCLMRHGADPGLLKSNDRRRSLSAADRPAEAGHQGLSELLRQWQAFKLIRSTWLLGQSHHPGRQSLMSVPWESLDSICSFLMPTPSEF